jgi:hypothetical protein
MNNRGTEAEIRRLHAATGYLADPRSAIGCAIPHHRHPHAPDIPETDVEIDGIAKLWYDDIEAFQRAAATPEMKALTDDGALFIGQIKTYVIEERQIIPPPG